ncbi:RDD family protein [Roseiconus lacunae]|uniref:RDD family protein n=1 Tax=Roseiconus lacunae TaxID=2605694 RepID=A0ABT7PKN4_9BACT|nr:RDD family protein [Roseiconus lacunae]MDM4017028.1 RDD family protein [Roseiconus lacunae]WRQ48959.1 RDD family protein [Stieleria sp. HD01]
MASAAPLDTTIGVVTPENIAFEYQLAGPFRRLPAYLIDFAIRWGLVILIWVALMVIGGMLSVISAFPGSLGQAMFVIGIFVIHWFYGTILEAYFNGRTVGKWLCGIRVIEIDGRPVSPRSALLRNLLRVADLAPVAAINTYQPEMPLLYVIPTGIVGLTTTMMTRRMQRLGDLAAGTMVVVDERKWQLPVVKVDDARVPALASFIPGDYLITRKMARTLATYAERRHFMTPPRRREIARKLSDPLIERFEFRKDIDPDLLLYALYYKTFLADSASEPADLGPLAGYSPLAKDANKPGGLGTVGGQVVTVTTTSVADSQANASMGS